MDMNTGSAGQAAADEFSLESILAEFSSAPHPPAAETKAAAAREKAQSEAAPPPPKAAKPEEKRKEEPAAAAELRPAAVLPAETAGGGQAAPHKAPEALEQERIDTAGDRVSDEKGSSEKEPANVVPIRRAKRPEVRAEDLVVPSAIAAEAVIDTAAFDSVYEKKQKRIKKLRQQILSENETAKKSVRKQKLKPAHIKTGPVPVPPAAKAEMERERAEKPAGQRYRRPAPKAAPPEPKPKPTLNPLSMLKKFERSRRSASVRFYLVFLLCIPLFYMTAASYLDLPMPEAASFAAHPRTHALINAGLLGMVIALSYDMIARGVAGLLMLRAGGETLVASSLCVSTAYCAAVAISPELCRDAAGAAAYAPVAVLPALAALFTLLGNKIKYKSYYRSIRSCYRLQRSKTLTVLPEKYDGDVIYTVANATNYQGFYRTFGENDAASAAMLWYSPLVLLVSLFLAVYCGYATNSGAPFLWCWSIITAFTPALGIPIAAALPLAKAAKRMYKSGVLLGGGKAVAHMAGRSFVLMTDDDIFPGDAISVNGYKLMNPDKKELALSVTASVLDAAQTALAKPFLRLASDSYAPLRPVSELVFSDAGGITGVVDGRRVMVGTASFVQRAWIKIPPDIKLKTAVFCVVDSELLAIFAVKYQVTPKADYALNLLEDNGYMPVVATRDFNVTAAFIQSRFGVSSSDVVYPPADLRVAMSDKSLALESDGLIVTYGGSDAVAEALISCRRYRTSARLSVIFSLLSSVIGLLLGTLMAYFGWAEAATPVNMLLYYLLWAVPPFVFAAWVNRF